MNGASISTSDYVVGSGSLQLLASSSQYLQVPPFRTDSNGLTFAGWFRSNSNPAYTRIFDFGNGASSDNILVYVEQVNLLNLLVYIGGSSSFKQIGFSNENVWQHFAWTLAPSGTWKVYVNGVSVGSVGGAGQEVYPATITRSFNCTVPRN